MNYRLVTTGTFVSYTSQAYTVLQQQFPLSLSLLTKLHNGGVDPLKAIKLLNERSIKSDIALLLYFILFMQREASFQDEEVVGKGEDCTLFVWGNGNFYIHNCWRKY